MDLAVQSRINIRPLDVHLLLLLRCHAFEFYHTAIRIVAVQVRGKAMADRKKGERVWLMRRPIGLAKASADAFKVKYARFTGDAVIIPDDVDLLYFALENAEMLLTLRDPNLALADHLSDFITSYIHIYRKEDQERAETVAVKLRMLIFTTTNCSPNSKGWDLFDDLSQSEFGSGLEENLTEDKLRTLVKIINELA